MDILHFEKYFTEKSFWEKIKRFSKSAGVKVIYAALLLYYVLTGKDAGIKTKISIAAALGYFILPTDAIFDLTPLIGYTDDMAILIFVLSQISSNITPEIKDRAKNKLAEWFGEINTEALQELESSIN